MKHPQCFGLTSRARKGADQQTPRAVAVRRAGDLAFEQCHRVGRQMRFDQCVGKIVDRPRMDLGQASDLSVGPLLTDELLERRPVPQCERPLQPGHRISATGRLADGSTELRRIHVAHQRVARAPGSEDGRAQGGAHPRHRGAQGTGRNVERVREPLGPEPTGRVQRQDRDQATLACAREIEQRPIARDPLHPAQDVHARNRPLRLAHGAHCRTRGDPIAGVASRGRPGRGLESAPTA